MERQYIIFILIFLIFLAAIIRQILYWSWLWQLKEYRRDRMRAHFQDIGFRSLFLSLIGYSSLRQKKMPRLTAKADAAIIFSFLSGIAALVFIVYAYQPQIFRMIFSFDTHYLSNINLSKDSINLPAVKSLVFNIVNSLGNYKVIAGIVAIIFLIMPLIIFLYIIILNILSGISKAVTIARAKKRIVKYPNLKVVGITGSYGKSTTKEILADILSKKYKVLKTPANINTAIGIAQLILDKLDESYEIFVVEMGAYKTGEIKEICDIVHPQIGIITAINEQHLALFGKIENTIKAKFELIDCLPEKGLAILNAGDANIQAGMELRSALDHGIKAKVKLYSVGAKSDVYTIGEACGRQNVKFKFISGANMKDFSINITGCHNTSNALAAIIAAENLNMSLDQISMILQKVSYLDIALKNSAGPNGSTLIDDTYNANPDGVFAALNHVKIQRGRKIIVMSSLIELGSRAHKIHQKLGKEISDIAAKVFFLDDYYISDIRKGAAKNKESYAEIIGEKSAKKISENLKDELKSSDTVLFINRGSRKVLELLKK